MNNASPQPDALLAWMNALSDPARLRLLRLLEQHELGVAELCDVLQMPQSTVSRHLKVLVDQRWLHSRRAGTNHLYEMATAELDATARKLWLLTRDQTQSWATVAQDDLRLAGVLSQRTNDSQAFFAGAAGDWDRIRNELYGHRFDLYALLPLLPREHLVADLGCGTAQLASELAPHVSRVIGVDNSADMLKAARKRLDGLENVDLRRGELSSLPMQDGEVDAALMILALTYVLDPQAAITEMARVLKRGGKAVVVDLLRHDREDFRRQHGQKWPGFVPARLEEMFGKAGLGLIRVRPLPPDASAKGPALVLGIATRP